MQNLKFKNWLFSELANYGFDYTFNDKIKGGTDAIDSENPIKPVDGSKIITELSRYQVGNFYPKQKWNDIVEYGDGPGAIQVGVTPLGSMKLIIRQLCKDLKGSSSWICQDVIALGDKETMNKENVVVDKVHQKINEISKQNIPSPARKYEEFNKLANKLWTGTKINHPSYIMFPVSFQKQNENYYKLVFEFRGHGVLNQQSSRPGRTEQFHIDVFWNENRGLIKIWGYNINSTLGQHSWNVQPSHFNEYFSPIQKREDIVNNVVKIFMQY